MNIFLNSFNRVMLMIAVAIFFTHFSEAAEKENKDGYRNFDRKFFIEFPIERLSIKSVAACKESFSKICTEEDYPYLTKKSICLIRNYDKFKANPNCQNLAHALFFQAALVKTAYIKPFCSIMFEHCGNEIKTKKTNKSMLKCILSQNKIPPFCDFILGTAIDYRTQLSKIYDSRLAD